ncbi:unnamed protein product [Cylindrotheca closterium]|uniref:Uncharacterized protein n=1 Tax=Cylindrotheca closterium TaxID=2856 RepID=A0AAD2FQG8_9STRA|nr:unnamed protein product [Cylindrotheca closterium]
MDTKHNGKVSSTLAGRNDPGVARLAGLSIGNVQEPFACPVNLDEERDTNASPRSDTTTAASVERRDDTFNNRASISRRNHVFHPYSAVFGSLPSYSAERREEEELSFPFVVDRKPKHGNLVRIPKPHRNANTGLPPFVSALLQPQQRNPSDSESSTLKQEARSHNIDYFAEFAPQKVYKSPTRPTNTIQRSIVNTPLGLAVLLNHDGSKPTSTPRSLPRHPANTIRPIQPQFAPSNSAQVATEQAQKFRRWQPEEDDVLKFAVETEGGPPINWKRIAHTYMNNTRTALQCKSRWTKSLKPGLARGPWTKEEDACILRYKQEGLKWSEISKYLPGRLPEHISDRYNNVLDPELKKDPWTNEEDRILFQEQRRIGNKWTQISHNIPGRSEKSVKNRWHNLKNTRKRRERSELFGRNARAKQQRFLETKLRLLKLEMTQKSSSPKIESAMVLEQKRLEEQLQSLQLVTTENPSVIKCEPIEVIEIDDD